MSDVLNKVNDSELKTGKSLKKNHNASPHVFLKHFEGDADHL